MSTQFKKSWNFCTIHTVWLKQEESIKTLSRLYNIVTFHKQNKNLSVWKFPNSVEIWVVYWAWAVHNVAADNPVINPAGTNVHYNLDDPASKYF